MEGFLSSPGKRFEMMNEKQTGKIEAIALEKEECEAAYKDIRKIYKFEACLNTNSQEESFEAVITLKDFGENCN